VRRPMFAPRLSVPALSGHLCIFLLGANEFQRVLPLPGVPGGYQAFPYCCGGTNVCSRAANSGAR
jgi:hypothetical protein